MNYQPAKAPWAKQGEALEAARAHKVFALLMAMRTGKTKVAIDRFGELELAGEADDLLVIAPAGVYETWRDALDEHLSQDLRQRLLVYLWKPGALSGVGKRKLEAFLAYRGGPRALIIDVEALSTVKAARDLVLAFSAQRRTMGAIDESTVIKNADSKRADFVLNRLRPLLAFRMILCGLPTPRSPLDLFGQFYFLDPHILGFWNYKAFEARYAVIDKICMLPDVVLRGKLKASIGTDRWNVPGVGVLSIGDLPRQQILSELSNRKVYVQTIPQLKGYRNEEELAAKIKPYSYRCLLSDCYDVPPKLYSFRDVEMTSAQAKAYKELKEFAVAELKELERTSYVTAPHVMTKILKLHQILCGHVKDEDGVIREIPENRTKETLGLLEEYDGKAIIWCSYDYNVRGVAEAISKRFGSPVARFWGGNRSTREAEERMFKEDPACRHIVATPSAGGKGRTWTVANLLIYYSCTNNLEYRAQSEERGDGNMKEDRIACVDLRCRGTVDEKNVAALRAKIDMAAKITGDNWREWLV